MDPHAHDSSESYQWGRFGFLIADLFLVLAMVFLVANTIGQVPPVKKVSIPPTATPTPAICGIAQQPIPDVIIPANDPDGLRQNPSRADAVQAFADQAKSTFNNTGQEVVGFALVFGGGATPGLGESLADGAIAGLQMLQNQNFTFFSRTRFEGYWDGQLPASNDVRLHMFLFQISNGVSCV